ncbi:secreted protein, partial [mine drainage metagenome]
MSSRSLKYTVACVIALAVVVVTGAARAADASPSGADVRVLSYSADVHVQPSGAYTDRMTQVIEALTRTGAQSLNPYQEEYSKSMATMRVESAYIVTADGRRIDIPAADIVERPAPAPPGSD